MPTSARKMLCIRRNVGSRSRSRVLFLLQTWLFPDSRLSAMIMSANAQANLSSLAVSLLMISCMISHLPFLHSIIRQLEDQDPLPGVAALKQVVTFDLVVKFQFVRGH